MESVDKMLSEAETQDECLYCESHVQTKTAKIFGDNDDNLYACFNCTSMKELTNGAGADPTYNDHEI